MRIVNSRFSPLFLLLFLATASMFSQQDCSEALAISGTGVYYGSTVGITYDGLASTCNWSIDNNGQHYYRFTPSQTGTLVLSTVNSFTTWDTKIHLFTGSCGALTCVNSNDDALGTLQSRVTQNVIGNTVYFIRVSGYQFGSGNFKLDVSYTQPNATVVLAGCTNASACNFNPLATQDDASCCFSGCYSIQVTPGFFPTEIDWYLVDQGNSVVAEGGAPHASTVCISACDYGLAMFDSWGDGWNDAVMTIRTVDGEVVQTTTMPIGDGPYVDEFVFSEQCGVISGCTSPNACNYEPLAVVDDGTCCFGDCYSIYVSEGLFPSELYWSISSASNGIIASQPTFEAAPYAGNFCVNEPSCDYTVVMGDSWGDGWNGAEFYIGDDAGQLVVTDSLIGGTSGISSTFELGDVNYDCSNPQASNYIPNAVCVDNSTCVYCAGGQAFSFSLSMPEFGFGSTLEMSVYDNMGYRVYSDVFYVAPGDTYYNDLCLNSGCYFVSIDYYDVVDGGPANRGFIETTYNWQLTSVSGSLIASGSALDAVPFRVGSGSCPLPSANLSIIAPYSGCIGQSTEILVYGMPNTVVNVFDIYTAYSASVQLDATGFGVFLTYPLYDYSGFRFTYGTTEYSSGYYIYPEVYMAITELPVASIVTEDVQICSGNDAQVILAGTPFAQLEYSIFQFNFDFYEQVFSGSVVLDESGLAQIQTGSVNLSQNYFLESVSYGGCVNEDIYDPFSIQVLNPQISESTLSTSSNVYCQGGLVEVVVDGGDPENIWNPNQYFGGTPGSGYSWSILQGPISTYQGSLNSVPAGNHFSINLGATTAGTFNIGVTEFVIGENIVCYSPLYQYPITVIAPEMPTFPSFGPYCSGAVVLPLPPNSTNNISGFWFPELSNTTSQTYTFVPNPEYCATTASAFVQINSSVAPSFSVSQSYCQSQSASALPLTSDNGITGSWNPASISTTAPGSLSYTFSPNNPSQCATSASLPVTVTANTPPQFSFATALCQNATSPVLPTTSNNGITGTWLPASISTATVGTFNYTFTPLAGNGCTSPLTIPVSVGNGIVPSFNIQTSYCNSDTPQSLPLTSSNGINGTWNPQAINTNVTGNSSYTFTPIAGQCAVSSTQVISVSEILLPTFAALGPYCESDAPEILPSTSENGISGTWSVASVPTSVPGNFPIVFTPATQCALTVNQTVQVLDGVSYYEDADGDGYGTMLNEILSCEPVDGFVLNASDCNDDLFAVNPAATEVCDGIDNDCDVLIDELPVGAITDCDGNCINDADNDGVCDELENGGCTDESACNYDPGATTDNGSCQYPQAYLDCNGNCINDSNANGICDEQEGCTDSAACNYDANALGDDGSCTYPVANLDCAGNCLNDTDNDGVCDENEVVGCMIETACNYNAAATDENGSCTFAAIGYDCDGNCIVDTNSNGICDPEEGLGCMNETACNYDPNANVDNGTCEFPDFGYDCLGNCTLDSDNDGVCDFNEIPGCTDAEACNYNPLSTDEDGSCEYPQLYLDCDGSCIHDVDGDLVCDELEISGCTDPDACNYTADATDDDGSCITQFELDPIIGPLTVITGNSYTYSTSIVEGATYDWIFTPNADCLAPCDGDAITVTFNSADNYAITVMAVNENYPTCSDVVSLVVTVEVPQQVTTLDDKSSCTVYPNPAMHQALLEVTSDWLGSTAELIDATGRSVWSMNVTHGVTTIDMSMHSVGIYSLTLVAPLTGQQRTLRVIKL